MVLICGYYGLAQNATVTNYTGTEFHKGIKHTRLSNNDSTSITNSQGRNHVLNIGGGTNFCIYIYIYALIDARTHIITRTQRLVNTTPRLLL